jgi:hypothetical protein
MSQTNQNVSKINQTQIIISDACPFVVADMIAMNYVVPGMTIFGIILNAFCVLVFTQILLKKRVEGHMFKYLLVKSLDDFIQFVFQIFSLMYYCDGCENTHSYGMNVWFIWFYYVGESILELASAWMEVLATFDCLLNISNKWSCFKSKFLSNLLIVIIHLIALFSQIYFSFEFNIVPNGSKSSESSNQTIYFSIKKTPFAYSIFATYLNYFHTISRDIIPFIILIFLDGLILKTFGKIMTRKKNLTQNQNNNLNKNNSSNSRIEKAERNNIIMIILTGLNFLIGHYSSILFYINFPVSPQFWSCFYDFNLVIFYLSYTTTFFFYLSFNKYFRHFFEKNVQLLLFFIKTKKKNATESLFSQSIYTKN